jgi:HK97 family phage major capsid protein
MLTAQLRSATTRAERRRAVSAFNASEASDPGSEYRDALDAYMRTGRDSELRAMGETDNTAGGFGVYAAFRDELVTQLKAYGSLYRDFQPVTTHAGAYQNVGEFFQLWRYPA